jgi:hypothetical protein
MVLLKEQQRLVKSPAANITINCCHSRSRYAAYSQQLHAWHFQQLMDGTHCCS